MNWVNSTYPGAAADPAGAVEGVRLAKALQYFSGTYLKGCPDSR